ncbi:hypothetical protein MNBD_GAMMA13-1025 [hydrothermal vent metagenome]|uniref:Uncharacterized protein n=1 Tax=hydrothermal vent metagenome TaxID=652676 RepID=A0A3B0Y6N0_9ZZZZ
MRRSVSINKTIMTYLHARLLSNEGQNEAALAELKKIEPIQTRNHPALYQTRGEILMAMHRWSDAIRMFHQLLELDPVNQGAYMGLCRCYLAQKGQQRQALEAAAACLGLAYHNPRVHFLCGIALEQLGRFNDAQHAYKTALAQNPVFPAAHRRLSCLSCYIG